MPRSGSQRRWQEQRKETQRILSALMDDAPAWRDWLEHQLHLLDLEYDPHHWLVMERIRG